MSMVQYGVWPNCCNNCDFCLRLNRHTWKLASMMKRLSIISGNIKTIDWSNKFSDGISLLGGELYFIKDEKLQNRFLHLIQVIIDYVLSASDKARYSTVTNGMYDPEFLIKVLDKINDQVGIKKADINFSYDIKYRFKNESRRLQCIDNINLVHKRYDYKVGVQTILTQYLIDSIMRGEFSIDDFENNVVPGNQLQLLYPHPISPKLPPLHDFQFNRNSFLKFMQYLRMEYPEHFNNFYSSTELSGVFKYTGCKDMLGSKNQDPVLSDNKEVLNERCNHSILYQCYSDSDKCMLCDLKEYFI